MYKIVIDANVWIRFARAKNITLLLNRFILYNFIPVVNNYLLSEIFDAIVGQKWIIVRTGLNQFLNQFHFFSQFG